MKIAFKNFLMTLKRYKVASLLNVLGLTLAFVAFYIIASQVYFSISYNRPMILSMFSTRKLVFSHCARMMQQFLSTQSLLRL